jgi:ribosomal protein S28E/S33
MRRHALRVYSAALLAAAFGLLHAQAKPTFGGTWKLNVGKSDFGAMPAPDTRNDKITHEDPDLTDSFTQSGQMGDFTAVLKYSTDGKETTNLIGGNEIKSTAQWEGDVLAIAGKTSVQGALMTVTDRWSISEDGKTLTIARHVAGPFGEADQKIVLEKQ